MLSAKNVNGHFLYGQLTKYAVAAGFAPIPAKESTHGLNKIPAVKKTHDGQAAIVATAEIQNGFVSAIQKNTQLTALSKGHCARADLNARYVSDVDEAMTSTHIMKIIRVHCL